MQHRGGLDRGAARDELVVGGDHDRAPGEVGDDAAVGRAARAAADEQDPSHRVAPASQRERVDPVEQAAHHALDRGARQLLAVSRRCAAR